MTSPNPQEGGKPHKALPAILPNHWSTPAGQEMAERYATMSRGELGRASESDFALANSIFMADRSDLDLIVFQTAAKERIRWLSVQLALAVAEIAELRAQATGGENGR